MKRIIILLFLSVGSFAFAQVGEIQRSSNDFHISPFKKIVEASSFLKEEGKPDTYYDAWNGSDFKFDTAWVEGVDGPGIREWIKITFKEWWYRKSENNKKNLDYVWVYRISIVNGFAISKDIYYANNRVKLLGIEFSDGTTMELKLKDGVLGYQRFMLKDKGIRAKWVKATILDVYKGKKYDDTCISEILVEETRTETEIHYKGVE